jgi:uncharacterized Zn-finger protein
MAMDTQITMIGISGPAQKGQIYPQFRNDRGASEIRIGSREFECIGQSPPQDHPHVYLEMGDDDQILCPYCSTLFRLDLSLGSFAAEPTERLFQPT